MALTIGQMRVAVQAIRDAHEIPSADGAETPPHASQVFDTPGDPKFAPLGEIFLGAVRAYAPRRDLPPRLSAVYRLRRSILLHQANFALIMFDATSLRSFEAVEAHRTAFLEANPQYDDGEPRHRRDASEMPPRGREGLTAMPSHAPV